MENSLAGQCKNKPDQKITQETKNLMRKRREMKENKEFKSKVEYIKI